jgi:hypothetical protein
MLGRGLFRVVANFSGYPILLPPNPVGLGFAATTLVAAGLLVSTFPLLLVAGEVFLPARDFFSIAIVLSPVFYLTALRTTLVQAHGQTFCYSEANLKLLKTKGNRRSVAPPRLVDLRSSPPHGLNFNPRGLNN